MRCARSWFLEQRWHLACEEPSPDGISQAVVEAYEDYRSHLANCSVCRDHIQYLHSVMDLSMTQEDLMGDKLAGILKTLIVKSAESGRGQHYLMPNGLRVDVRITPGQCSLLLSRETAFPSEIEWSVVTRHWHPSPLFVDHERVEQGGRHYLRASWTAEGLPVQLELKENQEVSA
jgi:hypothetical protein